jgi:hypothetical protein
MVSAASAPRTLLAVLAVLVMVAGVAGPQVACSLRSLDHLGNGHGQDGAMMGSDASDPGTGGAGATGGMTGTNTGCSSASTIAPPLPDITDSPVQGEITFSGEASWNIDGEQWPTFEIHTPTASYWLVKSAAAIVSITDSAATEWINLSSVRPNRGVPNLGGCCQPGDPSKLGLPTMSTDLDPSFTATYSHLRLLSKSDDCSYELVWDFFLTHVTVTINRAAKPFGFTYRGVPGGSLNASDQLLLCSAPPRSTATPFGGALTGAIQWATFTHPADNHSLFLIQHSDDSLPDGYRIADGDTSMFVFGGDQITQAPIRFSLGIIDRSDAQALYDRIGFVRDRIH